MKTVVWQGKRLATLAWEVLQVFDADGNVVYAGNCPYVLMRKRTYDKSPLLPDGMTLADFVAQSRVIDEGSESSPIPRDNYTDEQARQRLKELEPWNDELY